MIKKASKQAEEGVEVAEEVGAGEVAKETQTKRNEAHKTDRQLAGSSEGRARGVQNWNEMPCQSIFAWHAASSQPPSSPLSPSHITNRAPTMCDCQFQRHSRRCAGEKG